MSKTIFNTITCNQCGTKLESRNFYAPAWFSAQNVGWEVGIHGKPEDTKDYCTDCVKELSQSAQTTENSDNKSESDTEKITYSEAVVICATEEGATMRWHTWRETEYYSFSHNPRSFDNLKYYSEYVPDGKTELVSINTRQATEKGWIVVRKDHVELE